MPRQYSYQYETSPRKIKPEYNKPRKNTPQYNKPKSKIKPKIKTTAKAKVQKPKRELKKEIIKKQDEAKAQNKLLAKTKFAVGVKSVLLFLVIFFMIFMNSRLNESFTQIQKLKSRITEIQKENDQLAINIQNNINLNNIEQAAKELLGMQKLSSKQTFYINLPKEDYIEPRTEKVIIEEQKEEKTTINIFEKLKELF